MIQYGGKHDVRVRGMSGSLGAFMLKARASFEDVMQDGRVVEIGAGSGDLISTVFDLGARAYTGLERLPDQADKLVGRIQEFIAQSDSQQLPVRQREMRFPEAPYHELFSYHGDHTELSAVYTPDLRSYLADVPDESAFVISAGIFDEYVFQFPEGVNQREYLRGICDDIYRITPQGGFSLHLMADQLGLERVFDRVMEAQIEVQFTRSDGTFRTHQKKAYLFLKK